MLFDCLLSRNKNLFNEGNGRKLSILQCNTFVLHKAIIGLEYTFCLLFEGPLKTGPTVLRTFAETRFRYALSYFFVQLVCLINIYCILCLR